MAVSVGSSQELALTDPVTFVEAELIRAFHGFTYFLELLARSWASREVFAL